MFLQLRGVILAESGQTAECGTKCQNLRCAFKKTCKCVHETFTTTTPHCPTFILIYDKVAKSHRLAMRLVDNHLFSQWELLFSWISAWVSLLCGLFVFFVILFTKSINCCGLFYKWVHILINSKDTIMDHCYDCLFLCLEAWSLYFSGML